MALMMSLLRTAGAGTASYSSTSGSSSGGGADSASSPSSGELSACRQSWRSFLNDDAQESFMLSCVVKCAAHLDPGCTLPDQHTVAPLHVPITATGCRLMLAVCCRVTLSLP